MGEGRLFLSTNFHLSVSQPYFSGHCALPRISFLTTPAGCYSGSDVTGQIGLAFNETNFADRDENFFYEFGPWPHVYLGQFFFL